MHLKINLSIIRFLFQLTGADLFRLLLCVSAALIAAYLVVDGMLSLIVAGVGAIVSLYLLFVIVKGGQLKLTESGISDSYENSRFGVVAWRELSDAVIRESPSGDETLILLLRSEEKGEKEIMIHPRYYSLNATRLREIILGFIATTRAE